MRHPGARALLELWPSEGRRLHRRMRRPHPPQDLGLHHELPHPIARPEGNCHGKRLRSLPQTHLGNDGSGAGMDVPESDHHFGAGGPLLPVGSASGLLLALLPAPNGSCYARIQAS